MTEREWLECTDPAKKLCLFRGRLKSRYSRKIRLFACACCRLIWEHLVDDRSHNAVEVAERYADGQATDEELKAASSAASLAHGEMFDTIGKTGACLEWAAVYSAHPIPFHGARNVIWMAATPRCREIRTKRSNESDDICLIPCTVAKHTEPLSLELGKWKVTNLTEAEATGADKQTQLILLNDIFNNPFHPSTIDATWLRPNVAIVAQEIYATRAFNRMPSLGDVLEDVGCHDSDILAHCRGPGPHVRGCWVVDLLLGKE
jgi:hypothetical protein